MTTVLNFEKLAIIKPRISSAGMMYADALGGITKATEANNRDPRIYLVKRFFCQDSRIDMID